MFGKLDAEKTKLFDNRVFQEMLDTERSYNQALGLLNLALLMDTLVQENPVLQALKKIIPILKDISDGLLANAEKTVNPELSETERKVLKVQRTQLLTAFFMVYKDYAAIFDNYLTENNKYASENPSTPELNPFYKIDKYLTKHANSLGLQAHLIQPIQRGPRYSLLVIQAAESVSPKDENYQEFLSLQALISDKLFEINSSMAPTRATSGYWFGKITYTILFGDPDQPAKMSPPPVKNTPTPVLEVEEAPAKSKYRFGDLTRKYFWGNNTPVVEKTTVPKPVQNTPDLLVEEFTIVGDDSQKPVDDDNEQSNGLGYTS